MYKDILVVFSGSLVAQVITILALPLLTRLYSPESYGIFSSVLVVSSLLLVMSMGRYEQALIQQKKKKRRVEIFISSLAILITFTILLYFVTNTLNSAYIIYRSLPLIVFFYGLNVLLEKKVNSEGGFKILSQQKLIKTVVEISVASLFSIYYESYYGLILGVVFGLVTSSLFMLYYSDRVEINEFKMSEAKITLKKYLDFPKFNLPHALINSGMSYLPIIAIPFFFDVEFLGYYALAMKLIQTPFSLISSAIYNVVAPKIARDCYSSSGELSTLVFILFGQIILVLTTLFMLVALPGEEIFLFIFDDRWLISYNFMIIMLPWVLVTFIAMPFSCVTNIFLKQKKAFIIEIFVSIIKLAAIAIGGLYLSINGMLILFSIVSSLSVLVTFFWYVTLLKSCYV